MRALAAARRDGRTIGARGAVIFRSSPVTIEPADSISVASVAISTIGSFFGNAGMLETMAREMMRASDGTALEVLAGRRLAEAGEIGFEQVALRPRLALERPQLHVLAVGRGGLLLQLIQARAHAFGAGAGDARVVFQAARDLAGFLTQLPFEIADLRAQLLDARMVVEQRGRLLGELRAQGDALFAEAPHQLGIQDFGRLDRPARLQHAADQPRLGFGVRLLRPRVATAGC